MDYCPARAAHANAGASWARSPLSIACPTCGVRLGEPCIPKVDRHEEPTCVRCKTPIFMPDHVAVVIGEGPVHSRCPVVIEA